MMKKKSVMVLLVLVMVSAISVVYVRHQNRLAFMALQDQQRYGDDLQADWTKLMLESATWAAQHNVTVDAGQKLSMSVPEPGKIVVVEVNTNQ